MTSINKTAFNKALIKAVSQTYLKQLILDTPGDMLPNEWDVKITSEGIVIFHPNFELINWLEKGTKPHVIKPKPGNKFLRFKKSDKQYSKKSGGRKGIKTFEKDGFIFTEEVNHPGIKARQFIQHIMEDKNLNDKFSEILSSELIKLI